MRRESASNLHGAPRDLVTDPAMDLFAAVQAALEPHYRLERELGRGGMGVVYQATDRTLDRRVAIKVAHPELTEKAPIAQRFLAEARMLARIQHPNIVAIHQAGRVQNLHYYVMDEVPGESLRQLLNREGRLPVERARAIAADIAAALDAAGRARLRASRRQAGERAARQCDRTRAPGRFRYRAAIGRTPRGGSTTGQGIAVGTPAYMSPEQAAGEQVDARSDLYGLGVVAYEMLAGQPPFVGPNRVVVSRHLSERPAPLDRIRPDVPKRLAAAVMRALEKAPADRWQTGDDMRRALHGERVQRRGIAPPGAGCSRAAAVLLAAGLAGWFGLGGRGGPPAGVDPRHSMLLLPFENLQQDRTLGWLSDGSVSMLGLNLAQWTDLTVVEHDRLHDLLARHGVVLGDPIGLEMARRMARDAGVWTVVRGEFSWAGDTLRLVARVYDVASGARVHVARVDGHPGEDVRPMFDELAARLLDLSGAPADAVGPGLAASTTHSVEAFRRYLAGMDLLNSWNLPAAAGGVPAGDRDRLDLRVGVLPPVARDELDRDGGGLRRTGGAGPRVALRGSTFRSIIGSRSAHTRRSRAWTWSRRAHSISGYSRATGMTARHGTGSPNRGSTTPCPTAPWPTPRRIAHSAARSRSIPRTRCRTCTSPTC